MRCKHCVVFQLYMLFAAFERGSTLSFPALTRTPRVSIALCRERLRRERRRRHCGGSMGSPTTRVFFFCWQLLSPKCHHRRNSTHATQRATVQQHHERPGHSASSATTKANDHIASVYPTFWRHIGCPHTRAHSPYRIFFVGCVQRNKGVVVRKLSSSRCRQSPAPTADTVCVVQHRLGVKAAASSYFG